jgi:UrcA family protein
MTRLVDTFCVAAAAAAVLSGAADALILAPSLAEAQTVSVAVRYDDLKMDTPAATEVLERRVAVAARQVCGGEPDIRDLDRRPAFDACRADATQRALAQLQTTRALALAHGRGVSLPAGR